MMYDKNIICSEANTSIYLYKHEDAQGIWWLAHMKGNKGLCFSCIVYKCPVDLLPQGLSLNFSEFRRRKKGFKIILDNYKYGAILHVYIIWLRISQKM